MAGACCLRREHDHAEGLIRQLSSELVCRVLFLADIAINCPRWVCPEGLRLCITVQPVPVRPTISPFPRGRSDSGRYGLWLAIGWSASTFIHRLRGINIISSQTTASSSGVSPVYHNKSPLYLPSMHTHHDLHVASPHRAVASAMEFTGSLDTSTSLSAFMLLTHLKLESPSVPFIPPRALG